MRKLYFQKEFVIFVLCGGFSAVFNLLARVWLDQFVSYALSVVLSYFVGMVTAFMLNRMLVFGKGSSESDLVARVFLRFALVNAVSMMQTVLVSLLFKEMIFPRMRMFYHPKEAAHFLGLASTTFTSFIGHKFFTFRDKC